jgi:hypothetical protein
MLNMAGVPKTIRIGGFGSIRFLFASGLKSWSRLAYSPGSDSSSGHPHKVSLPALLAKEMLVSYDQDFDHIESVTRIEPKE